MISGRPKAKNLPLDVEEGAACSSAGARLASALEGIIQGLGEDATAVWRLTEYLGVDRNICQRVVGACREAGDGREVLVRAPGIRGLEIFVSAYDSQGGDAGIVREAREAIKVFSRLIGSLAGSQTRLIARIKATKVDLEEPLTAEAAMLAREQRFDADVQLWGISAASSLHLNIFQPVPDKPGMMESAQISSWTGLRLHHRGVPFATRHYTHLDPPGEIGIKTIDHKDLLEDSDSFLIEEFSSKPAPSLMCHGTGNKSISVFDVELAVGDQPLDIAWGKLLTPAGPLPLETPTPYIRQRTCPRFPVRASSIDVYMHRSMVGNMVPGGGAYIHSLESASLRESWFERLPASPLLEVHDLSLQMPDSKSHASYGDVIRHSFERLGWPLEDFMAYRFDVAYPMVGVDYRFEFTFSR